MDALQAIKERYSCRSFTDEPVPENLIEDLVDCARFAPTARNVQPWEFIAVTDAGRLRDIAELTDHGKFIGQAAACIAICSKETKYYLEDGSAATVTLLLAAHAHGLGACWVAGDKKPYAGPVCRLLGVPEGYRLVSLVAVGHPAGRAPSRSKRSTTDILHIDKW